MTSLNYFNIACLPSVFNTFFYFVMPEERLLLISNLKM